MDESSASSATYFFDVGPMIEIARIVFKYFERSLPRCGVPKNIIADTEDIIALNIGLESPKTNA